MSDAAATQRLNVLVSQLPSYQRVSLPCYDELRRTIATITTPGKGILAADESVGSVTKRFAGIKLENNAENRRRYRALMIGAPGIEKYIAGVIFHEETLFQQMDGGSSFPEFCAKLGIVPGIKTDGGVAPLCEGAPGEQQTQGLDNYAARAKKYYKQGARFCKWRNVYRIQNGTVSEALVRWNAETLARYAVMSQLNGLVPIVEPEVMIDGTHTLAQCQAVSEHVWAAVVDALHRHGVVWECCLLKPNMVVPGAESGLTASAADVARATITALSRTIPAALPGINFLSGGLSEVQASEYLSAMNNITDIARPWRVSFSYARALQSSALKAWGGKPENVEAGRRAFLHRAKMNSLAQLGKYSRAADDKESQSLYVKGNSY